MNAEKSKLLSYLASIRNKSLGFRLRLSFLGGLCILIFCMCTDCGAENIIQSGRGIPSTEEVASDIDEEIYILSIGKVQASSVTIEFSEKHNDGLCMVAVYDEDGEEAASASYRVNQEQKLVQVKMDIPATPAIYEIQAFFMDDNRPEQYEAEPVTAAMYSDTVSTSRVSGVFVAPRLSSKADSQQWRDALWKMRDIGIDTVIVQYCFQQDPRYGKQAYFPYAEEDTYPDAASFPLRRSQIEYILSAAQDAGIQVYLGLQIAEYEWFKQDMYRDRQWLQDQSTLSLKFADALWAAYGAQYGDAIAGWYLPFEFESSNEYQLYFQQITESYYSPLTLALKKRKQYGNRKIMISPLMYQTSDPAVWQDAIEIILSDSMIDVIAPQDGMGYGTQSHNSVGDWFYATRKIVDKVNTAQSKNISLWANCENYKRLRGSVEADDIERKKPMSISKFITNMDIVAPYVDKLVTFSIHRWDTAMLESSLVDVNLSYYEAYKRYYQTGRKPSGVAEGYYVDITIEDGIQLKFNEYAQAGLTDGFAANPNKWSGYKGISTESTAPFFMEILFDDPIRIRSITSNYYEDISAGIWLPQLVEYEYLVVSGKNNNLPVYIPISTDRFQDADGITTSSAIIDVPVMADGIRVTVFPNGEWTFIDDIFVE